MDGIFAKLPYYKIGKNKVVKIDKSFMYKTGPSSMLLAFGPYLGHPYMSYISVAVQFNSRQEIEGFKLKDEKHLDDIVNDPNYSSDPQLKEDYQHIAELVVAEKALLRSFSLRYPVVVIGLEEKSPLDVLDHFRNLGYSDLTL